MTTPLVPSRRLGRSGLIVSRLCLGTMMFGAQTEEADARRIIEDAAGSGVNFIDTADTYAGGLSEMIVGRAIAANRDAWVLATKVANPAGEGLNRRGLSRKWLMEEVPRSLGRLGTDYVDILYLHKEDRETPLEETVRAMADLQRSGAIRYFGVSNFRSWRVAALCALCDEEGIDRPVVSQPLYHALNRTAEVEMLPACFHFGLGVMAYSPLARGVLTGKYTTELATPADSRAGRGDKRILETEFHPDALSAAATLGAQAARRGVELQAFATAWVLANPMVTGVVAGPRTIEQWRAYIAALHFEITPEDEAAVNIVTCAGATAVAGYSDPAYPIEGRPIAF